ncbi:hypothetical protein SAMN02745166_04420 [Prosthecobacter debontii]|uniref:MORN repeat variant n=1 Tax=Prosthecobacter debontii TaxID=48467 RepID=A0A1T4YWV2_9BACT|nr:hypothetical protein [Prosthecobacter debontii]SKB06216.1 hypothetical protein SAMN02745166_04420 [Prosthecobacter debontii]
MTRLPLFLLLCFAALLCSCSMSFHREWKAALKAGPQEGVEGAWEGTWQSDVNGHHGKLRSVVGPVKNAEGDHSFHYHATWGKILSGAYRADHRVRQVKNVSAFQGQHQMPNWAGGLYTYEGTVKGDDFKATYECSMDKGSFTMKRVR